LDVQLNKLNDTLKNEVAQYNSLLSARRIEPIKTTP
jgi:hypothetical protein